MKARKKLCVRRTRAGRETKRIEEKGELNSNTQVKLCVNDQPELHEQQKAQQQWIDDALPQKYTK